MSTEAPRGTSLSEAFAAFYNLISPKEPISSHDEAMRLFYTYCPNKKCTYVRDKYLGVDFRNFPQIDTSSYQKTYGNHSVGDAFKNRVQFPDQAERSKCVYFTGEKIDSEFAEQVNYCNTFTKIISELKKSDPCTVIFQTEISFPIGDSCHTDEVTSTIPLGKINETFFLKYHEKFPLEFCFKKFFWTKCHPMESMPLEDFNELLKMHNKKA